MTEDELWAALRRDYQTAQIARVALRTAADGGRVVDVYSGRPGILIGKRGATAEKLGAWLDGVLGPIKLQIREIRRIELEPVLLADAVLGKLATGVPFASVLERQTALSVRAGARACRIAIYGEHGEHERHAIADGAADFDWTDGVVAHAAVDGGAIRCEVWIALPPAVS